MVQPLVFRQPVRWHDSVTIASNQDEKRVQKTPVIPKSFFTTEDGDWFTPTEHTRGPWDVNACHAGPPTGLLARAVEQLIPDKRLIRLTVDLLRPIPFAGFQVRASITRSGRSTAASAASLVNREGKTVAAATSLHMLKQSPIEYPTHTIPSIKPTEANDGPFPIQTLHDKPAFNGSGVQIKYPDGENSGPGPTTVWMKTVPLLVSETPSAFQRICPLADCGNAFGRNAEPSEVSFVNPDLTVVLHRDPVGDWLGSQSVGYWEATGQGLADALLFDEHGAVGRALQTMLLKRN